MTDRLSAAALEALKTQADAATRDWPAVKRWIEGAGVMAHVHGAPYAGPSIDFDAIITVLPALLTEVEASRQREGAQPVRAGQPAPFNDETVSYEHFGTPKGDPVTQSEVEAGRARTWQPSEADVHMIKRALDFYLDTSEHPWTRPNECLAMAKDLRARLPLTP